MKGKDFSVSWQRRLISLSLVLAMLLPTVAQAAQEPLSQETPDVVELPLETDPIQDGALPSREPAGEPAPEEPRPTVTPEAVPAPDGETDGGDRPEGPDHTPEPTPEPTGELPALPPESTQTPEEDASAGEAGEEPLPEEPQPATPAPEPSDGGLLEEVALQLNGAIEAQAAGDPRTPVTVQRLTVEIGNGADAEGKNMIFGDAAHQDYFKVESPLLEQDDPVNYTSFLNKLGSAISSSSSARLITTTAPRGSTNQEMAKYAATMCFLPANVEEGLGRVPDAAFLGFYYDSRTDRSQPVTDWSALTPMEKFTEEDYDRLSSELIMASNPLQTFGEKYAKEDVVGCYWTGQLYQGSPALETLGDAMEMNSNGVSGSLYVVGRWEPSANAALRDLSLRDGNAEVTLYEEDLIGRAADSLTEAALDQEAGGVYYLRVPAGTEELSLSLDAFEPYFTYNELGQGSAPVQISLRQAGSKTTTIFSQDKVAHAILNAPQKTEIDAAHSYYTAQNSAAAPAASRWSATVPLKPAEGWDEAADQTWKNYNELQIAVTAPDGSTQITFTFFIQRLADPTLTRAYGNTPAGMIERELDYSDLQRPIPGFQPGEREQMRDYWSANRALVGSGAPKFTSEVNNAGNIYAGKYHTFTDGDLFSFDNDSTAIVVYQNSAFQDPGFTITDSQGNVVDFADVADRGSLYYGSVSRRLRLDVMDQLGPTSLTETDPAKLHSVYYTGDRTTTPVDEASNEGKLLLTADTQQIDLRSVNVLPGVYQLEYFYTDPYAAETFSASGGGFHDGGRAPCFSRTLVVLPKPGDVNMDGVVNMADYRAIRQYWQAGGEGSSGAFNKVSITSSDRLKLVAARVMDVNHDGTLTNADVEALCGSFNALSLQENIHYLPLPNDLEQETRVPYDQESHAGSSNGLRLRYMGTGSTPNAQPSETDKVQLGQLFWVGLELEDPAVGSLWTKGLDSMTFSITYDSTYLIPAVDTSQTSYQDSGLTMDKLASDRNIMDLWRMMMGQQNVGSGSTATVWQENYTINSLVSRPAGQPVYTDRPARPVTAMEDRVSASRRREVVVSLERVAAVNPYSFTAGQGGVLLVVPFYLRSYPYKNDPYLLELGLGDREIVVTTTDHYTAAYLANQEERELFGGSHHVNISSSSNFPHGITLDVPLGEDTTVAFDLKDTNTGKNAVYGEPFVCRTNYYITDGSALPELPPGITYDPITGLFSGTPEKAGTYVFNVMSTRLRLTVEKAPLRIFAEAKSRYYGEEQLVDRATNILGAETYTFRYLTQDIKDLDLARITAENGVVNNGRGVSLPALLGEGTMVGQPRAQEKDESDEDYQIYLEEYRQEYTIAYTAPTFQAYVNNTLPHDTSDYVDKYTGVGPYSIDYAVGSAHLTTNYDFRLATLEEVRSTGYTFQPNNLQISRRPIYVHWFDPEYVANEDVTFYNDGGFYISNLTATRTAGQEPFKLSIPNTDRLTGDALLDPSHELTISIQLQILQNDDDKAVEGTGYTFNLGNDVSQTRTAFVYNHENIRLVNADEGAARNYIISEAYAASSDKDMMVRVRVTRRAISALTITSAPGMSYTYGQSVSSDNLLRVSNIAGYGKDQKVEGPYVYDPVNFAGRGFYVCWLTGSAKEEMETLDAAGLLAYLKENGAVDDHNKVVAPEKVGLPFSSGTPITSEHAGRYLCVWTTTTDETNTPIAILDMWETPLTFTPKTLTLTLPHLERYYGEDNPAVGGLFTYDPSELAGWDIVAGLTGDGSELMDKVFLTNTPDEDLADDATALARKHRIGDYTEPAVDIRTSGGEPVDKWTPANNIDRARITIQGACVSSGNYVFRYTRSPNENVSPTYDDTEGYSTLRIVPRPVVVERVFSSGDYPLATLYADTRSMELTTGQTSPKDSGRELLSAMPIDWTDWHETGGLSVAYPDGNTHTQGFTLAMPHAQVNGESQAGWYYQSAGPTAIASTPALDQLGYDPDTAVAVVLKEDGSLPDLKLEYKLTAISDKELWGDIVTNRFDMGGATSKDGSCQISAITLSGADAGNYQLVFNRPDDAVNRMPSGRIYTQSETYSDTNTIKNMYRAGTVKLTLRPIADFELVYAPRVEYTYGDPFTPNLAANTNGHPFTIRLVYETELDNAPELNRVHCNEQLAFTQGAQGEPDSFAQRGLYIFYQRPGETVTITRDDLDHYADHQRALPLYAPLYVDRHDGASLIVAGQRPGVERVVQQTTQQTTLTVHKRELPLRVVEAYRYYGEENPVFGFYFDRDDLATWDRGSLPTFPSGAAATAALTALETAHGGTYTAPSFTTAAVPASDVVEEGYGGYDLILRGGSMTNYTFTYTDGLLHVLRRPIQVASFAQDTARPIYTIFSDVGNNVFYTNVSNYNHNYSDPGNAPLDCLVTMSIAGGTYDNAYNDPAYPIGMGSLPMNGAALVTRDHNGVSQADEINLRVKVTFPENRGSWPSVGTSSTDFYGTVDVSEWTLTNETPDCKNYFVLTAGTQQKQAPGMVKLRNISGIEITQCPQLTYTYGEELSLRGLEVRISMVQGASGTADNIRVRYAGPDDFASYGLYVNYYDQATPPNTQEAWNSVFTDYRTASSGDHLTIAPAHDNCTLKPLDPGGTFAHNGKYLIVSARLPGYQDFAQPQMVRLNPDSVTQNVGTPIQVNPLQLTYTLEASDKTYDGSVDTAGTIRLTNAFNQPAQLMYTMKTIVDPSLDVIISDGFDLRLETVTDAIYVAVGADYEKGTGGWRGFSALRDYINGSGGEAGKGYAFTTGTYSGDLDSNGLSYTGGSNYNRNNHLNFQFVDDSEDNGPDVAYAQDQDNTTDTHVWGEVTDKAVQVTNIRLAGPDAANYTLTAANTTRAVTKDTVNSEHANGGYQAAALPRATVHKANRPKLVTRPQVELDPHTNAMRVFYDAAAINSLSAIYSHDRKDDALHLEYALQGIKKESDDTIVPIQTQALASVLALWGVDAVHYYYSDNPHFGGELVRPDLTGLEDYIPEEEDYPRENSGEDTTYYGQLYPWAGEDAEVRHAVEAYPGGVATDEEGHTLTYEYPAYWLYDWSEAGERTPLERDTVYWGLVRVAETWNYLPSPPVSSVDEDVDRAAYTAQQSLEDIPGAESCADAGGKLALAALNAIHTAQAEARTELETLRKLAETGEWPDDGHYPADRAWPRTEEADEAESGFRRSAIKTYTQRLELISIAGRSGAREPAPEEDYRVPKLEAVWFSDLDSLGLQGEKLEGKDELDAFARNYQPNRYYGYFWDALMEAEVAFDFEEPDVEVRGWDGDLTKAFTITYTGADAEGNEETKTLTVNTGRDLTLYVDDTANSSGGILEKTISVTPNPLVTYLGAGPIQLTVVYDPEYTTNKWVTWTSTDPNVVTVDRNGLVTIVGVGECDIIARSRAGRTVTVHVVVDYRNPMEARFPQSVIDLGYAPALFGLDRSYYFFPSRYMTREELIRLLARLCRENENRKLGDAVRFSDMPADDPSLAADVDLLTRMGILTGVDGGLLAGSQIATRAEMVTMLARMLTPDVAGDPAAAHVFADAGPEDTWAWAYIDFLTREGIIQGVDGSHFAPDRGLTRAEAAAFLVRLLESRNMTWLQEEYRIPVDVPSDHWGYQEILKALNGRRDYFDEP